jgi:ribosomal protein S18 acetylase RimI-like enzyme
MLVIRPAIAQDVPLICSLIHEFAEFEHDHTIATDENLLRDGFGAKPMFRVLLAESDGEPAGYSLFFDCYASFQGPGIYLEDIFVRPQFRGAGIGRALCSKVAAIARNENRFSIMLTVMDWNRRAIDFYQRLGATFLDDWKVVCLKGDSLEVLARETRELIRG